MSGTQNPISQMENVQYPIYVRSKSGNYYHKIAGPNLVYSSCVLSKEDGTFEVSYKSGKPDLYSWKLIMSGEQVSYEEYQAALVNALARIKSALDRVT